MMKFASLLYMNGGPALYSFFENNASVPSSRRARALIESSCDRARSGELDFKGLFEHMRKLGAKIVVISEDATRMKSQATYDPSTNSIVGLTSPIVCSTGLPDPDVFTVGTPHQLVRLLETHKKAKFVQAIVAEPLCLGSSPFVLGFFVTNTDYTAQEYVWRLRHIEEQLSAEGFQMIVSTDGCPALFAAQKFLNGFGYPNKLFGYEFMCQPGESPKWILAIQDPLHLVNKMKNRLFDSASDIKIGRFTASSKHLEVLQQNGSLSKIDHELTETIVGSDRSKDKMNTVGTENVCHKKVHPLLKKYVPGSDGTIQLLKIMDFLLDAFVREKTPDRERLFKCIYVLEFLRRWITDQKRRRRGFESSFTKHCFECVELNTFFLVNLLARGNGSLIRLCSSQACEKLFRQLRSMSTLGSTQINFSEYELVSKLRKAKLTQQFMSELQQTGFKFNERLINALPASEEAVDILSSSDISQTISEAVLEAKKSCDELGLMAVNYNMSRIFNPTRVNIDLSEEMSSFFLDQLDDDEQDSDEGDAADNIEFDNIDIDCEGDKVFKYRNIRLLNEANDSSSFLTCDEEGNVTGSLGKQTLLWTIQEDPEHISTDRRMRFHSGVRRKAFCYVWDDDGSDVFKPNGVKPGQWIVVKKGNSLRLGYVLKFQYMNAKNKLAKSYTYKSAIFNVNQGVELLLSPCFSLNKSSGCFNDLNGWNYFPLEAYVCTLRESVVDADNKKLSSDVLANILYFTEDN